MVICLVAYADSFGEAIVIGNVIATAALLISSLAGAYYNGEWLKIPRKGAMEY
jgi:hypothetical protein